MGPIEALERVAYLQDRGLLSSRKTEAFLHAAEVLRALPEDEVHRRIGNGTLTDLPGIGSSTAEVATQAAAEREMYKLIDEKVRKGYVETPRPPQ